MAFVRFNGRGNVRLLDPAFRSFAACQGSGCCTSPRQVLSAGCAAIRPLVTAISVGHLTFRGSHLLSPSWASTWLRLDTHQTGVNPGPKVAAIYRCEIPNLQGGTLSKRIRFPVIPRRLPPFTRRMDTRKNASARAKNTLTQSLLEANLAAKRTCERELTSGAGCGAAGPVFFSDQVQSHAFLQLPLGSVGFDSGPRPELSLGPGLRRRDGRLLLDP